MSAILSNFKAKYGTRRSSRRSDQRRVRQRRLIVEGLEERTLLATVSWASAVSGNWSDGTKWDTGNSPGLNDDVIMNASGSNYTVTLDVDVTGGEALDSLVVNSSDATFSASGRTFTVNGSSTVSDGTLSWTNSIWAGTGTLTNASTMVMRRSGGAGISQIATDLVNEGSLFVKGTANQMTGSVLNEATGTLQLETVSGMMTTQLGLTSGMTNRGLLKMTAVGLPATQFSPIVLTSAGGSVVNELGGTIEVELGSGRADSTRTITAQVENAGTFSVSNVSAFLNGAYTQTAGETSLGGGTISSSTPLDIQGGSVSGSGNISGGVANGGQLSPGFSAGSITSLGFYTQTTTGAYAVEIGGLVPGSDYDRLDVTGTVTLDGSLGVSFINGYSASATTGDTFAIINNDGVEGVVGTFNGLSEGDTFFLGSVQLQVSYAGGDGNDVTLLVLSTNQPPAIAAQSFNSAENQTSVGTVVASDSDLPSDTLTFTITDNGPDDTKFSITTGGVLSFNAAPDFENPTDVGGMAGDNTYLVEVRVEDAAGDNATATMMVTVTDVDPSSGSQEVIGQIEDFKDSGVLSNGQANPIVNHLDQALKDLDKGKTAHAIQKLEQARDEIQDLIDDGDLTPSQGEPLIDTLNDLIVELLSGSALRAAEPSAVVDLSRALTADALQPTIADAIAHWSHLEQAHLLHEVSVEIRDLPGAFLGFASPPVIWIDRDAAGHGWFLGNASPPPGHMDLQSVVSHEFGHVLGFDHDHGAQVMGATLQVGQRILSHAPQVTPLNSFDVESLAWLPSGSVVVSSLYNGDFSLQVSSELTRDNVFSSHQVLPLSMTGEEDETLERKHVGNYEHRFLDGQLLDNEQEWNDLVDQVFVELGEAVAAGVQN